MTRLYREEILQHARTPAYRGKIEEADITASLANSTCGDSITLYLKTKDSCVEQAVFEGEGCLISQAAADMFAEHILGKTLNEIKSISKDEIFDFFHGSLTEARKTCALLAYEALGREIKK